MTAGQLWAAEHHKTGGGQKIRASLSEIFALILKAGIGSGLPLGHTQALAAASGWFAQSPNLMISVAGALMRSHLPLVCREDGETLFIADCGAAMAAPAVVDALIDGTRVVHLAGVDFPDVLMALLDKAQSDYGVFFDLEEGKSGAFNVRLAASGQMQDTSELQLVPTAAIEALKDMAAKTFVPESDLSRVKGAGASLDDND